MNPISKPRLWTGRILSGLVVAFLALDAGMKIARATPAVEGTVQLGYPADAVLPMGLILAVSMIIHLIPRTAVLGAVLVTGYLGGAVATHLRVGNPLLSHTLFPVYFGILMWLGLGLRDRRVRNLVE